MSQAVIPSKTMTIGESGSISNHSIALAMAGLLPLTLTFHRSRLTWINKSNAGFGYDFLVTR